MENDSLGNRMKNLYEDSYRITLPGRMPIIIRVDGKAFHTLLRACTRPYDYNIVECMNETAKYLCKNIQGAQIAFTQSDEISILVNNYKELETQPWLGNNLQKIASISAGMASAIFTTNYSKVLNEVKLAIFDSRAFVIPKEEVQNYFVWRQLDAKRNSIQSLARSLFSHKECNDKNTLELKNLCLTKGVNWDDCPNQQKYGRCIKKVKLRKQGTNLKTGEIFEAERSEWIVDNYIPIFSQDPNYINQYV